MCPGGAKIKPPFEMGVSDLEERKNMCLLQLNNITIESKIENSVYMDYYDEIQEIANELLKRLLDKRAFVDVGKNIILFVERIENDILVHMRETHRNDWEHHRVKDFFVE